MTNRVWKPFFYCRWPRRRVAFVAGPGGTCRNPPAAPAHEWRPNVEQPIRQLEEFLASLEQQQPRNYTITNISFLYDALLYIELNERERRLPDAARAEFRSRHDRWRERRDELSRGRPRNMVAREVPSHPMWLRRCRSS